MTSLLLSPASAGCVQPDQSPAGHNVRRSSAMRGPRVWLSAGARLRPVPALIPPPSPTQYTGFTSHPGPRASGRGPSGFAASGSAASGFAASCDPPLFEDTVCTGDARFSDHALARCLPVKSAQLMPFCSVTVVNRRIRRIRCHRHLPILATRGLRPAGQRPASRRLSRRTFGSGKNGIYHATLEI